MSNISRILYEKYYTNKDNKDNKDNKKDTESSSASNASSEYRDQLRLAFTERGYSEEDIQLWANIE